MLGTFRSPIRPSPTAVYGSLHWSAVGQPAAKVAGLGSTGLICARTVEGVVRRDRLRIHDGKMLTAGGVGLGGVRGVEGSRCRRSGAGGGRGHLAFKYLVDVVLGHTECAAWVGRPLRQGEGRGIQEEFKVSTGVRLSAENVSQTA